MAAVVLQRAVMAALVRVREAVEEEGESGEEGEEESGLVGERTVSFCFVEERGDLGACAMISAERRGNGENRETDANNGAYVQGNTSTG